MDQIEKLQTKMAAMAAELAESAAARRRTAVQAELARQSPSAPDIVRRLAASELSGSGDVAGEVREFLASEAVSPLVSQPAPEKKANQGKRPSLSEMIGEVKSGDAKFKIG